MTADTNHKPLCALLLAAGESSRMGRLKALLQWGEEPLIAYQVRCLLDAGAERVVVVLGHRAEEVRPIVPSLPGVQIVVNTRYRDGKTTSIKAGLAQLPAHPDGLVLLAVDQPRPKALVAALVGLYRERRAPVTQPVFMGHRGHPMVFRSDVIPRLATIQEETKGIKPVVDSYRDQALLVPVDSPIILLDLNTPEDYRKAWDLWLEATRTRQH